MPEVREVLTESGSPGALLRRGRQTCQCGFHRRQLKQPLGAAWGGSAGTHQWLAV
ncbi:MAG: hypothetical protein LC749_13920 [Actinobacteria bacterium]|nr:hypothetical protein [Actinomycetota bacterium]